MVSRTRGWKEASEKSEAGNDGSDKRGDYEEARLQRIKENMERMKSLGIAELSKQLKPPPPPPSLRKFKPAPSSLDPPRRSPRLEGMPAVVYSDIRPKKKEDSSKKDRSRPVKREHALMKVRHHIWEGESSESSSDDEDSADEDSEDEDGKIMDDSEIEIVIPEGENPEIYTDEHEKLLGDSVAAWDLFVDGFDEDGNRMYDDAFQSKNCHQCRLKTVGLVTKCRKCNKATGQFCGDCLYMRYGENVKEVNLNRDWVCPVCRGICNCIRCRRDKGWSPTGEIYSKVEKFGFKSVAHYLIRTRHERATVGLGDTKSPSTGGSRTDDDDKEGSSDELSQSGTKENKVTEDTTEPDCDGECEEDDHDDKNGNIDSNVEME